MLNPKILRAALAVALCSFAASMPSAEAAEKLVTADKFNRLIAVMKTMYKRIDELEGKLQIQNQVNTSGSERVSREELDRLRLKVSQLEAELKGPRGSVPVPAKEGAVNLDDMDKAAPSAASGKGMPLPLLKIYFDLNFYSLPGGPSQGSGLTFDNFHSFVLLDVNPTEDISFSTIVMTSPHFYELDYKLASNFTLRMGKIWIPFDDMNPHNLFGGNTNVSRIMVGDAFLPDLFTDLGVGLRWKMFDSSAFSFVTDAYVVNGFQSGGTDPVTAGSKYPNFATLPTGADNNRDKSVGGRAHALIGNVLGIGSSIYTGRWTNKDDEYRKLLAFGVDAQLYLGSTSLRGGIASMDVKLPSSASKENYMRGGSYVELGQKFGPTDQWTFLVRGGQLNLDDRLVDRNDKQVVGAKLMWKPNLLEWSIEHSKDVKVLAAKSVTSFTNFRVVASF